MFQPVRTAAARPARVLTEEQVRQCEQAGCATPGLLKRDVLMAVFTQDCAELLDVLGRQPEGEFGPAGGQEDFIGHASSMARLWSGS